MRLSYIIVVDTREQENGHILEAFKRNNILYERRKLDTGDYAVEVNGELLPVRIERKNGVDEIVSNLIESKNGKSKNRFFRELDRVEAEGIEKLIILIEDEAFYRKILNHEYRSRATVSSIRGLLMSIEAKYKRVHLSGVDKSYMASYINSILYYHVKEYLKN